MNPAFVELLLCDDRNWEEVKRFDRFTCVVCHDLMKGQPGVKQGPDLFIGGVLHYGCIEKYIEQERRQMNGSNEGS